MLERYRSAQLVRYRDTTIEVEFDGYVLGEQGVLVAHSDAPAGAWSSSRTARSTRW
ncbi:MAG: hypothetical protein JNM77_00215 [Pseudonocardia sp.]|nr:hypothetical protein [Pseudonocardia sp.]